MKKIVFILLVFVCVHTAKASDTTYVFAKPNNIVVTIPDSVYNWGNSFDQNVAAYKGEKNLVSHSPDVNYKGINYYFYDTHYYLIFSNKTGKNELVPFTSSYINFAWELVIICLGIFTIFVLIEYSRFFSKNVLVNIIAYFFPIFLACILFIFHVISFRYHPESLYFFLILPVFGSALLNGGIKVMEVFLMILLSIFIVITCIFRKILPGYESFAVAVIIGSIFGILTGYYWKKKKEMNDAEAVKRKNFNATEIG